jgi:hypothetical protein
MFKPSRSPATAIVACVCFGLFADPSGALAQKRTRADSRMNRSGDAQPADPGVCGNGVCDPGEACVCPDCTSIPIFEVNCGDGFDDDCDTLIDCADADCAGSAACSQRGPCNADLARPGQCGADGQVNSADFNYIQQCVFGGFNPCMVDCELNCDGALTPHDVQVVNCIITGGTPADCCPGCGSITILPQQPTVCPAVATVCPTVISQCPCDPTRCPAARRA